MELVLSLLKLFGSKSIEEIGSGLGKDIYDLLKKWITGKEEMEILENWNKNQANFENNRQLQLFSEKISENSSIINEIRDILDNYKFTFSPEVISAIEKEKKFRKPTLRLIPLENEKGKYGYYNTETKSWEIEPIYYRANNFYNGYAMVYLDSYNYNHYVTFIDLQGNIVCHWEKQNEEYWHCGEVSEGFIKVGKVDKESGKDVYGYFNIFTKIQIEPKFIRCEDFKNGLAKVEIENKMRGLINTKGEYVFKKGHNTIIQREYAFWLRGELILASETDSPTLGLLTTDGKWAIEPKYYSLYKKNKSDTSCILDGLIGEKWYKIDYYLNEIEV